MAIIPSPELERISRRLAAEKGLGDEARLELVGAYLEFLAAAAASRGAVFPSTAIDEIWHQHILCTQSYARDCARWFGTFIHHQPETLRDAWSSDLADCSAPAPPCNGIRASLADCSAPEPEPPCRGMAASSAR